MKKILLLLLCTPWLTRAQAGSFDTSFALTGKKTLYVQQEMTRSNRIAVLPDGSLLTAGYSYSQDYGGGAFSGVFINKHLENGDADTSFGNNGTVYYNNYAAANSLISSLKVQPDGKIILSGAISGQAEVRRLNADGTPDITFGTNGIVSIGLNYVGCMSLAPDGKIVVIGQYWDGAVNVYELHRYNADGSADTAFGDSGVVHADVTSYKFDLALDVAVQPDYKIVVAGKSYLTLENAVVCRFNPDGSPDTGFADNGVAIVVLSPDAGNGAFERLALLPDGKIVAAGYALGLFGTGGYNATTPAVARLNANGSLDDAFGTDGKVILPTLFDANDQFNALHLQSDGKILAGGSASYPYPYMRSQYYLTRISTTGAVDTGFGTEGRLLFDFTGSDGDYLNYLQDIQQTADGRIVTTGFTGYSNTEGMQMIICRFNNDDTMDIEDTQAADFAIYPNPSTAVLTIALPQGSCDVLLYNMQGQLVLSHPRETFKGSISLEGLATGNYVLSVSTNWGTVVKHIVKAR